MFALAARNFGKVSETFVDQHARGIAPGRSVFVSLDRTPPTGLGGPALIDFRRFPRACDADGAPLPGYAPRPRLTVLPGRASRAVAHFLRHHGVTTMMAEFGPYGCKLLPAAEAAGVRYFVHFHGWDASRVLDDPRIVASYRDLFARAQGFFAPSQYIADNLIGIGCPPDRIAVTPCGILPGDFALSERVPGRMLAVGRFVEKKAPQHSIAAFLAVAPEHPQAHLEMIGDGPLLAECQALVREAGLADRVSFLGSQGHDVVRAKMREAAIFVQHSVTAKSGDTEGLPVAILEAMASGHCVISTRHSGIPEAVEDGRSGLLVDEHDVDGMAAAMRIALGDPARAGAMGDAARKRAVEVFAFENSLRTLRERMGLA